MLTVPALMTEATVAAGSAVHAAPVTLTVVDVMPSAPVRTSKPAPLVVALTIRNSGDTALKNVVLRANRGTPIANQAALTSALNVTDPKPDGYPIKAKTNVKVDIPAGKTVTSTFTTTTSILDDRSGLCLCDNVVYPIAISAYTSDGTRLATVNTYVPSFVNKVAPVKVSWVWPLIDRPHRLGSDSVFTDDALANSVSGGRLDNALRTLELLTNDIPITVVIDPELLDELEVMATGNYRVQLAGGSSTVSGVGQGPASDWLTRLKTLLADTPSIRVALTPPADPDVQALTRDGLSWTTTVGRRATARITDALAGSAPVSDVAWPAEGAVTTPTLDRLAQDANSTIILNSASVAPAGTDGLSRSTASLPTANGSVLAAMTDPVLQREVALATDLSSGDGASPAALPALTASLAIRAIQTGEQPTYAVLTPPRYVDANPDAASRVVNETTAEPFTAPLALQNLPATRPEAGRLRGSTLTQRGMPAELVSDVQTITQTAPAVRALLGKTSAAKPVLSSLPLALQRLKSTAWRTATGNPYGADFGVPLAAAFAKIVDGYVTGVRIVSPSSGSYTLGSDSSNLPITVENMLPYTVQVQVRVSAVQGVPGYVGKLTAAKIAPNSLQTVQVASRVERSGRIPVEAQLFTPNSFALGKPVQLSVDSTVFGVIGVLITVIAGGILVIALLVRLLRRLRPRRKPAAGAA